MKSNRAKMIAALDKQTSASAQVITLTLEAIDDIRLDLMIVRDAITSLNNEDCEALFTRLNEEHTSTDSEEFLSLLTYLQNVIDNAQLVRGKSIEL